MNRPPPIDKPLLAMTPDEELIATNKVTEDEVSEMVATKAYQVYRARLKADSNYYLDLAIRDRDQSWDYIRGILTGIRHSLLLVEDLLATARAVAVESAPKAGRAKEFADFPSEEQ